MEIPIEKGPSELDDFVKKCTNELFNGKTHLFAFPDDCFSEKWPVDQIKNLNKDFLEEVNGNANIYVISIRERGTKSWKKMYVGQRKSSYMRDRMREHLIKKDDQTRSMLERIKEAVSNKKEVGISFIKVEPDSLRLFVEEMIIKANKKTLEWNSHG